MATEKVLKLLKELCGKIETESDCTAAVANLKTQISIPINQTFFEYHTFSNFLEIFARNENIPAINKNEILQLMNSIVVKGSDSILGKLHSYLLSNKVSQ